MKIGRINIHAHLIPGIDDGCPSLEDSIQCARMFAAAGYTHLTCTPHVWPQLAANTLETIRRKTIEVQEAYGDAGLDLTLLPGGEINIEWYWPTIKEVAHAGVV